MQRWTIEEKAKFSGLSRNTIRNLESGELSPRNGTLTKLSTAFENVGIEFTPDGVRRTQPGLKILSGEDSIDAFLDLLAQTAKRTGTEIIGIFPFQSMLMKSLSIENGKVDRLKKILVHADMKFLFGRLDAQPFSIEHCDYKQAPQSCYCATPFFIFDNQIVMLCYLDPDNYKFAIYRNADIALANRDYFASAWSAASFFPDPTVQENMARLQVS